ARSVGENRHGALVTDLHRRQQDLPTGRSGLLRGDVRIGGVQIDGPHIAVRVLVLLPHETGDRATAVTEDRVAAVLRIVAGIGLPAEQFGVERDGTVGVGTGQIDPYGCSGPGAMFGHDVLL